MAETGTYATASKTAKRPLEAIDSHLKGTTYRVYRFILKQRAPVGVSEVQRGLGLSSPSVSQYHLKKLMEFGLIREEQGGYVVDKVVIDNIIRIRKVSIPLQTAYVAFFGVTLVILLLILRPALVNSVYLFAVIVNISALGISLYEMIKTMRRL